MIKSNYGENATIKTEALQQENEEAKEIIAELEAENSHLKELKNYYKYLPKYWQGLKDL